MRYAYAFYWNMAEDEKGRNLGLMDGFETGQSLCIAYAGTLEINEDSGDPFERLFEIFNAPGARPADYRGPSMSVGSVVELVALTNDEELPPSTVKACGSFGFEDADITESDFLPRPAEWIQSPIFKTPLFRRPVKFENGVFVDGHLRAQAARELGLLPEEDV